MADVPQPPTLAAELYTALRLSRQRIRLMVAFTAVVCVVTIGLAAGQPTINEATVDVDVAAFAVSGTEAFELQSLTDDFLNALTAPSTIRQTAEQLSVSTDDLDAGISPQRNENATRVTVAYRDEDVDRAAEIALVTSQNALRELAQQRIASATRDVDAAGVRVDEASAALDAFEAGIGQSNIPGEFDRLTSLVDQLTTELARTSDAARVTIQAALDDAVARRAVLEPAVREAEGLEAERAGALDQRLAASTRLSQARSQLGAASSEVVVQPGFSSAASKLPGLITALASGLVIGALASYALTWVLLARGLLRGTDDRT